MKQVIAFIQPFDFEQKIAVLEGGVLKMQVSVPLQDLAPRLFQIAVQDDITDIVLKGIEQFAVQIKQNIETYEQTSYGENKLNIQIAN